MKNIAQLTVRVLAILLIVALAGALRERAVQLLPVDYDEDDYLRAGQIYAEGMRAGDWSVFTRENYRPEHPPLAKIVYGAALLTVDPFPPIQDISVDAPISTNLPKEPLRAARTASAILNMIEVALLTVLNPLAGFFISVHTFTIKYASQVYLEGLPTLTSLLIVFFYMRFLKTGRRKPFWMVLSAISLGLTAASKYYYCISGVAVAAHWIWTTYPNDRKVTVRRLWQRLAPVVAWSLVALTFFFAADPYLWPDPVGRLKESILFHGGYATSAQVQAANLPFWQPLNWLMISVPWHPGVFVISIDIFITILAVLGFARARKTYPVYMLWLALGLGFLLIWPTKWPQYILLITAPLSLAAAEGLKANIYEPVMHWFSRLRTRKTRLAVARPKFDSARKVLPWLLPSLIVLVLISLFPLIFQAAISMTDFQATAIKDGVNGGVFREVWLGITGQVKPNLDALSGGMPKQVHYAGLYLLSNLVVGFGTNYVFEFIWTILAVVTQLALGVGVALLLHRKGVFLGGAWKTLFILPWAIPEFVAALGWSQIFEPRFGLFSLAAKTWSQQAPALAELNTSLHQNPNFGLAMLLLAALWYGFPFMFLSALAGLKMVPVDVYDAAAMDGASGWKLFRYVTWPLIFPLLIPAIIIRAIFAFNQFYLFTVMPAPGITMAASSFYIFSDGNYAVSAAINIVIVLILIFMVRGFNRLSKAEEGLTYA